MKYPSRRILFFWLIAFFALSSTVQAESVIEGSWNTQANEFNLRVGQRYTIQFPANGMVSGRIWGTGIYTTDCSVASAAVHAGIITTESGGTVTIEILPGQSSYQGIIQNGVSSFSWGNFGTSFVFVNKYRPHENNSGVVYGNWSTQATEYNDKVGQQFTFYFPPGGPITGLVWGTGIYTIDCSIASAAVHAGLLTTDRGGLVTIEILPAQNGYKGSVRNGVTSRNWGASYFNSFRFVQPRWRRL